DGALNPRSAAANRSYGARCRHSEVVVPVPMHRYVRANPLANFTYQELGGFRSAGSDRIHYYNFAGTGFESREVRFLQKAELRAGAIDGEERNLDSVLFRERDGGGNAAKHVIL